MSKRYLITFAYLLQVILRVSPSEYIETPFTKYGVILTSEPKKLTHGHKMFPMVLHGKTFECHVPTEMKVAENPFPNLKLISKSLDNMTCLTWRKDKKWSFFVCPRNLLLLNVADRILINMGRMQNDSLVKKRLQGHWEEGEKSFMVRSYSNGSSCGDNGSSLSAKVRYFCRQTVEENIFNLHSVSACELLVYIYTPRVCSRTDFESAIYCSSPVDAKELVLKNENKMLSSDIHQTFGAKVFPNKVFGHPYLLLNAGLPKFDVVNGLKVVSSKKGKKKYQAAEILSATMGIEFNFNVLPKNASRYLP